MLSEDLSSSILGILNAGTRCSLSLRSLGCIVILPLLCESYSSSSFNLSILEEDLTSPIERTLGSNVDALAKPVRASVGMGVALLPPTILGPMLENKRDGEGSPGEEDIAAAAA